MFSHIRAIAVTITLALLMNGCAFLRTATRPHSQRSIGLEVAANVSSGEAPTPTPGFRSSFVYRRDGWRAGLGGWATMRVSAPMTHNSDPLSIESELAEVSACRAWERLRPRIVVCGIMGAGILVATRATHDHGLITERGATAASRLRLSIEIPLESDTDASSEASAVLFSSVEGALHFTPAVITADSPDPVWEQPIFGWSLSLGVRMDVSPH